MIAITILRNLRNPEKSLKRLFILTSDIYNHSFNTVINVTAPVYCTL